MFDENDLKILETLIKKPRASISEIADETGLSRPTVHARLERILKEGIIKGLSIELDEEKLGGRLFLVSLYSEKPADTVDHLLGLPGIDEAFITPGHPNVHAFFYVYDLDSLANLLENVKLIDSQAEIKLVSLRRKVNNTLERLIASQKASVKCETCGVSIKGSPYVYVYKNKKHYFCCPVCRQRFIEKISHEARPPH